MSAGSGQDRENGMLDSWKEIAAYLGRDVSTAQRWEHTRALPVHRIQGGKRGAVYALKSELETWRLQGRTDPRLSPAFARLRAWRWALVAGIIPGAITILIWRAAAPSPAAALRFAPLLSLSGLEADPAFSPDGRRIAFSYRPEGGGDYDLYLKPSGTGDPLQLTRTADTDRFPQWSPDSAQLAFIRRSRKEAAIWLIGASGTGEYKLTTIRLLATDGETTLAWSPSGDELIFSDREDNTTPAALYSLRLATRARTRLTHPPPDTVGDLRPVVSPKADLLAFTRRSVSRVSDIWTVQRSGGEPRRITWDNRNISGIAWTADGKGILFTSDRGGPDPAIWRVPAAGGAPTLVAVLPSHSRSVAIDARTGRIAYTRFVVRSSIWAYDLGGPSTATPKPRRLITSGSIQAHPQYSPDGRSIAFMSDRSGSMEIWAADADGNRPRQLTSLHGEGGCPRWSPDGKRIAFDMRIEGKHGVFVVDAQGGPSLPVTFDSEGAPSWSADGNWIYFNSGRTGRLEVWKAHPNGESMEQVTRHGGAIAFETPDGRVLYYSKAPEQPGIFRKVLASGEEAPFLPDFRPAYLGFWQVGHGGVYFLDIGAQGGITRRVLKLAPHDGGEAKVVATLAPSEYPSVFDLVSWHPLAISPDEHTILLPFMDQRQSNIMISEMGH